MGNRSSKSKG